MRFLLRFASILILVLDAGCSAPLRVVEDPKSPRAVGERAPGTHLEDGDDSTLPTLPPTLQTARQRLLQIAALVANNGLIERRSSEVLRFATQALREEVVTPTVPLPRSDVIEEFDAALLAASSAWRWTSEDDLVSKGAGGILTGLPPRTAYFRRDEARRRFLPLPEETFGLTLGAAVPYPVVLTVAEGSSAAFAFVRPGEQLTEISGRSTSGRSLGAINAELVLTMEDDVTLGFQSGGEETRRVVLRRSSLALGHALRCRLLNRTVLYLKPGQIGPGTAGQAKEASLSAGEMARRVIVDLRDSSGGSLLSGVAFVDAFAEKGLIAEIQMRDKVVRWNARSGDPLERSATILLVGPRTNETATMVAAALQDLKQARILGEPTAANGEVTTWFWLKGGDALVLTIGQARRRSKPLERVIPDSLPQETLRDDVWIDDTPCPGSVTTTPVSSDPLVRRALGLLSPGH